MLYYIYMTGFMLSKIVPLGGAYSIARFVARVCFSLSKLSREALRDNLKVVLGAEVTYDEMDRTIFSIFTNFAKYLADFFRISKLSEEYITENVDISGRENLDDALSDGKGVILVALHLGSWEMGAALVGALGYELSVIALEHPNKRINNFFNSQRAVNGVDSISTGVNVKNCFKILKKNQMVAIAADKGYTATGVEVDFFGKKTLLPRGAAVISLRTKAPIVFTVLTREKGDKFRLVLERPIRYSSTGDSDSDVKGLIGEYVKLFEKYISAYPEQWYAFGKIWDLK